MNARTITRRRARFRRALRLGAKRDTPRARSAVFRAARLYYRAVDAHPWHARPARDLLHLLNQVLASTLLREGGGA